VREILEALPDAAQTIVLAALEGLKAEKFYWDAASKGMVHEPDYRTRLDAAKFLAAYLDGLPMQTTLAVNVGGPQGANEPDLEAAVKASPALRQRLEKIVSPKRKQIAQG
jgi:hypothetical protein